MLGPNDTVDFPLGRARYYGTHVPYPEYFYRRKRMTIAVGMVCTDGVLVCADTRHTVTGECVWDDAKMAKGTVRGSVDYIMTGCGSTSYMNMAFDQIGAAIRKTKGSAGTDFRALIQKEIKGIHRHIKACSDPKSDLPWLELIIGLHASPSSPVLWHVENTGAISRVQGEIFIGSGRPIAKGFARILLTRPLPLELAKFAAFFFAYQAKRSGYGTGGDTQMCYLPRPKSMGVWDDRAMAEQIEKMMRLWLMDARDRSMTDEKFNERCQESFRQLQAIRSSVCRGNSPKTGP